MNIYGKFKDYYDSALVYGQDPNCSWNQHISDDDTKLIPIISGTKNIGYKVVGSSLVDSDLYFELSKILWIKDSRDYVKASMSRDNLSRITKNNICYHPECKYILLHRTILGIQGLPHKEVVGDHINGNTLDNRRCNLRLASAEDNSRNSKLMGSNKSGYVGVDILPSCPNNPYRVRLYRSGSFVLCEYYETATAAARRYDSFLRENYPSKFNRYNFPLEDESGVDR